MMKRLAIVSSLAAALAVAGCGGNDNPTGPSNQPVVFTVQLSPANEVPPVANAESSGRGTAVITIHPTRDSSGTLTAATFDFNVSMTGFPNGTVIRAAHIHPGAAGVNGSPVVDTGLQAAGGVTLANGSGTFTFSGVSPTSVDQANQVLANPRNFYFNIHSASNGGGVARGQLQ
jgi:CHRD domain-containing protein